MEQAREKYLSLRKSTRLDVAATIEEVMYKSYYYSQTNLRRKKN